MEERTSGIILRTHLLTETSLIVRWLTKDYGRISTVAKGARRPKSVFRGKLDLYYQADFSYMRSRKSDLHNLKEVNLMNTREMLRLNIGFLQQAAYAVALVEHATEAETPLPEVYDLMAAFLGSLPKYPKNPHTIYTFELKLLRLLGLEPDWEELNCSKEIMTFMETLSEKDIGEAGGIPFDENLSRQADSLLIRLLLRSFERILARREAAVRIET